MRIAVIGTGNMGTGLGRALAAAGHEVIVGSRDPDRAKAVAKQLGAAGGVGYRTAAEEAEAVLLAVNWWDVEETLGALGSLEGKILIDITNPYADATFSTLLDFPGSSGAQELQKKLPGARVVKAWNHVPAPVVHSSPRFDGVAATVFVCGDHGGAKQAVISLARDLGYDPVNAGPLSSARYLEALAGLIITLGAGLGMGFDQAIALLRR